MTTAAWESYAQTRSAPRRAVNAAGATTWFNWTQYPDHGPAEELLAPQAGQTIVDLGCGKGGNIAHLATLGVNAVGVDISRRQLDSARARWQHLGVRWCEADAVEYLRTAGPVHAVYSVFGAVWFGDPERTLPIVRECLVAGGRLVFSHRPPVPGCFGCQAVYIRPSDGAEPMVVRRWDYLPEVWSELLVRHGFTAVTAEVVAGPDGSVERGTLLVAARATG